jgi:hypothetical protein
MAEKTPEQLKQEADQKRQAQAAKKPTHSASSHDHSDMPHLAIVHAHEARVKELELELESEKKHLADIEAMTAIDPGDLGHGEQGWIELDEEGTPISAATREPPPPGTLAAPVVGYYPIQAEPLVTPTGAPIKPNMQPQPDPRDVGMEERIKESLASAGKTEKQLAAERVAHQQGNPGAVNTQPRT